MRHLHLDQLLYSLRLPYSLCSGQSQRYFLYVHMSFIEYKCTVLCVYFQSVMYFAIQKKKSILCRFSTGQYVTSFRRRSGWWNSWSFGAFVPCMHRPVRIYFVQEKETSHGRLPASVFTSIHRVSWQYSCSRDQ